MPHPNDGDILACMDGELEPADDTRVREHLEACAECRERLELLRHESEGFSRALIALDEVEAPAADPGPIPAIATLPVSRHRVRRAGWSMARAAGLVLVIAGAAAALVPGSPVRTWLGELLSEAVEPPASPVENTTVTGPTDAPTGLGPAAISVTPEANRLLISLRGFGRESNVRVRLTDAERAAVRVEGATGSPRFVTGPGLLEVIGTEDGDVWVELPRSVSDALVEVDGEPAVRIRDGQLRILRPVLDSLREDVVFRIGE